MRQTRDFHGFFDKSYKRKFKFEILPYQKIQFFNKNNYLREF